MRRVAMAGLAGLVLIAGVAHAATPTKAKVHGFAVSGTVASVNETKKTVVVRNAAGKQITLVWTSATSVFGGKLAAGQSVTARYLDRESKHIATSIRITPPPGVPTASPGPAPSPSPSG